MDKGQITHDIAVALAVKDSSSVSDAVTKYLEILPLVEAAYDECNPSKGKGGTVELGKRPF